MSAEQSAREMTAEVKALADRAALLDLVHRYAVTVDARDLAGLADGFSDHAAAEYAGGVRLEGREAIRSFMAEAFQTHMGIDCPSTHLMTNTLVDLDGDEAGLRTTAIACLTGQPGKVIVRGLRYTDRCIREGQRWRVLHRRHEADWGFEAEAQFVATLAANTSVSGASNGTD